MSLLLNISPRPLEKVIYFASYIVTHVDYELLQSSVDQIRSVVENQQQLGRDAGRRARGRREGRAG